VIFNKKSGINRQGRMKLVPSSAVKANKGLPGCGQAIIRVMNRQFLKAGILSCLLLGLNTIDLRAQSASETKDYSREVTLDDIIQAADTLLTFEGKLILEGKILIYDLEGLESLKGDIEKSGDAAWLKKYIELKEHFTALMHKIELSILTGFSAEDWEHIRQGYETERQQTLSEIETLTDSLVIAYSPMFSSDKGKMLLSKVEDREKLLIDFSYRLGVLYLEQAELRYDRESQAWDSLLDSLASNPEAEIPPEPVKDYSLAEAKFRDMLNKYPTSDYADDALYNLAYIKMQSADDAVKAEGVRYLDKFTERFPGSEYYPEVEMRLGEYYFNPPLNDLDNAKLHYIKVIGHPESVHYTNALYRLGWSYYRNNEYAEAITYFTKTIDETMQRVQAGAYSNLMEESIENLSKSFATDTTDAIRGINSAVEYLQQNPERLELFGGRLLKRIGSIFQTDLGEYRQAVVAYDTVLAIFPMDADAPELQKQKIKCHEQLGDKDQVNNEKYLYFRNYNSSSVWAKAQSDADKVKEANLLAEKNLRDVVREAVLHSSETKQRDDYAEAVKLCRDYVEYYPNTTETYRINYNMAVMLTLNLQDFYPAVLENIKVARKYPEGKYHETCAVNAVECAYRLMEQEKSGALTLPAADKIDIGLPPETLAKIPDYTAAPPVKKSVEAEVKPSLEEEIQNEGAPVPQDAITPAEPDTTIKDQGGGFEGKEGLDYGPNPFDPAQAPSEAGGEQPPTASSEAQSVQAAAPVDSLAPTSLLSSEVVYLMAVQNYLDMYPKGDKADTYLLNAGVIFHRHNLFAGSRHYLEKLVEEYPQSAKREEAYKTMLDGYFVSKDYKNTEVLAKKLTMMGFSKDLTDLATARVGESIYSSAKQLEEKQDYVTAGSEYKRVALETPNYKFADNALWESALQFMKAAAWDSAVVSFELLVQKAAKSEWADKSINNIAFIYQNNKQDKRRAAQTFERLFDNYPKSEFARTGLTNASVNYSDLEDFASALRVNEKYLKAFPNAEDAVQVLYENAELYLKMGDLAKAINAFADFTRKYPDDPRNIRAEYQMGKYYLEKNDLVKAKSSFERTVQLHRNMLGKGQKGFPRFASFALDKLLEGKFQEYFKIDYMVLGTISANRARKEALKKELEQGFGELISFRQSEAIQAIFDLCRLDEDIARTEVEQAVPAASGQAAMTAREDILAKSLPLYVTSAQSYYSARIEIQNWVTALTEQQATISQRLAGLDALREASGFLAPDSQTVYDNESANLKEVKTSLELSTVLKDSCTRKIAEIYFNDAVYVDEVYRQFTGLPDQGEDRRMKMFFRAGLLSQLVAPRLMNTLELYRQAWIAADTVNAPQLWKDKSAEGAVSAFNFFIDQYKEVIGRPFERYEINLNSFRQRVRDMDESAYDITDAPLLYLDFYKVFIDSMFISASAVPQWISQDKFQPAFYPQLNAIFTDIIYHYYDQYSDIRAKNKGYYSDYDKKFGETGDDLYFEGMDLFELITGYVTDYQDELLEKAVEKYEACAVATESGDKLLKEMVKKDPIGYGYLVGLSVEGMGAVLSGNEAWQVSPQASSNFFKADYDLSGWTNAVIAPPVKASLPDTTVIPQPNPQDPASPMQEPDTAAAEGMEEEIIYEEQPLADTTAEQETPPPDTSAAEEQPIAEQAVEPTAEEQVPPPDTSAVEEQQAVEPTAEEQEPPPDTSAVEEQQAVETTAEEQAPPPDTSAVEEQQAVEPTAEEQAPPPDTSAVEEQQAVEPTAEEQAPPPDTSAVEEQQAVEPTAEEQEPPPDTSAVEEAPAAPVYDYSALEALGVPAITISEPSAKVYYRYTFNIVGRPVSGVVTISADNKFALYLNEQFVGEAGDAGMAYLTPVNYTVNSFLRPGDNIIAVEVVDEDLSGQGLWFKLDYSVMPDNIDQLPIVHPQK